MPASATGGAKPAAEVRAIVETLGLDGSVLGDGDFSALSLSHSNDQYTSSELERLVNIQAELEELSTAEEQDIGGSGDGLTVEGEDVEVSDTSTTFEHGQGDTILEHSPETILPDVLEGTETDVHQVRIASPPPKVLETVKRPVSSHQPLVSTSLLYSSAAGTKSSQVTGSSIVVIQSPTSSNPSGITSGAPTHLTFSGGQLLGKISGMSNLTTIGSMPQFQSLGQTLVTAKSADGNIVQLRPASISRSITATNTTGNTNPGTIQGIRPLQATIKRPGTSLSAPMRNVYAKVIIGNHSGQVNQGQPFMISTSQSGIGEATFTNRQAVKLINTSGGTQGTAILGTPPKAITLSQAQQMGLLTPSKLQQILPSSANKQSIILNKLVTSPGKSNATKITMVPSSTVMKSPTKILPAPVGSITQLKPTSTLASGPTLSVAATSASTTFRPLNSPQKVIIRQSALKSGTVLTSSGTGQMIRIPATQNIIGTLPGGKQVQYVRLVSTANSSTANVVSHTKPRTTTVFPVSAPKPLAITTVRNQPQALKVVPIAPATSAIRTVVPKPTTTTQNSQRILIPTSTPVTQLRAAPSVTTLSASGVSQLMPGTTILQSSTGNYVMLPAQYIQQIQNQQANQQQQQQQHVSVPPSLPPASSQSSSSSSQSPPDSTVSGTDSHSQSRSSVTRTTVEPNGIRPRKPCNCTKSQCLKLYCDCFANGEFCHMCNCNNCYNNLEHEEDRQRAIKSCLERNSNAFRPKIGKGVVGDERRHNKGCNCKRSGCLKNYCECYEAKISCSHNCKCIGCRNVEELCEKKSLRDLADAAEVSVQQHVAVKSKLSAHIESIASRSNTASGAKQPSNFMTQDVVDATCQCLLAQADEAERFRYSEDEAERLIIEEFGKCLVQIIECASNN